jgi:hypothetical protein
LHESLYLNCTILVIQHYEGDTIAQQIDWGRIPEDTRDGMVFALVFGVGGPREQATLRIVAQQATKNFFVPQWPVLGRSLAFKFNDPLPLEHSTPINMTIEDDYGTSSFTSVLVLERSGGAQLTLTDDNANLNKLFLRPFGSKKVPSEGVTFTLP